MKKNFTSLFPLLLMGATFSYAQVGINTEEPVGTLDIKYSNEYRGAQGVLIPRLTLAELKELERQNVYGQEQDGILIQITDLTLEEIEEEEQGIESTNSTENVVALGSYYFNAADGKWYPTNTESWTSIATGDPATINDHEIYKDGRVAVGENQIHNSAQMQISSTNKGVLIPRHTTDSRNRIEDPANGLMIFNVTTNCLNYYDQASEEWLSMCGTYDPAHLELICDSDDQNEKPLINLNQSQELTRQNTYTIQVNVVEMGTYNILLRSNNGYSYSASGTFIETGNRTVVLEGSGSPINPGVNKFPNDLSLTFNGIDVNTTNFCLPGFNITSTLTSFDVDCDQIIKGGQDYYIDTEFDENHYVEVKIPADADRRETVYTLEATSSNANFKFSSGPINITRDEQTIRLYAIKEAGQQLSIGQYTFTINAPGQTNPCTFSIEVKNNLGNYNTPGLGCKNLLDTGITTDGYYWIKAKDGSEKVKTYCDMTNGGWTLVRSYSEKEFLDRSTSTHINVGLYNQPAVNQISNPNEKFNEYKFSIANTLLRKIFKDQLINMRINIKQNGHTTDPNATIEEIESSTYRVSGNPDDEKVDRWATENFLIYNFTYSYATSPIIASSTSEHHFKMEDSRIFNYILRKPNVGSRYIYNGYEHNNPASFQNNTTYFGYYGGHDRTYKFAYQQIDYTYKDTPVENSNTYHYSFDAKQIWHLMLQHEHDNESINHNFLKCKDDDNSYTEINGEKFYLNDYAGKTVCKQKKAYRIQHRFNRIHGTSGDGEENFHGRIQQVWIK